MQDIGIWDVIWVVAVAIQATLTAYVTHPQGKALLITFPVPFSVAFLALGEPIESTHILASAMLLPFMLLVRILHVNLRQHIVVGLAAAVLMFAATGTLATRYLPKTAAAFYIILAVVIALGAVLVVAMPYREEPGHRSTMPVWMKLLLIVGGILLLIQVKQLLRGFVTVFPLVSVVAAYEARKSLYTMVRQVPVKMVVTSLMMLGMYLAHPVVGVFGSLLVGWCVFGIALPVVSYIKDARIPKVDDATPVLLDDA